MARRSRHPDMEQFASRGARSRSGSGRGALSATMLVTRAEEWCVEARNAEEARELLAQGLGHRCHLGERLQFEVESVEG
jgi:hypothetical protein